MCADEISSRARAIHFSSLVFDTHADTPQRLFFDQFDFAKRDPEGCVDIPRLREGGVGAVFFALWVPVEITGAAATRRAWDLLEAVAKQIEIHSSDLTLCTSSKAVREARAENKIAVLLGIEGGHAIDNDLAVLREFHARGVRYMTLTHNAATDWADSSNDAPRHNGLTDFGKQVTPGNEPAGNARGYFPCLRCHVLRRSGNLPRPGDRVPFLLPRALQRSAKSQRLDDPGARVPRGRDSYHVS